MADDRLVFAGAQAGDRSGWRILVVADRKMEEEVLDRLDVQPLQFRRRALTNALQHRNRRVQPPDDRRRRRRPHELALFSPPLPGWGGGLGWACGRGGREVRARKFDDPPRFAIPVAV